jgi:tripartite tricarboxylate transporter TctB family protein
MVSRRSLEAATALLTGAFGAAVALSSLGNGIGWSSSGVDAGTFPFMTGLIILSGSVFNLARGWLQDRDVMLRSSDLQRLGALFLPAVAYVGAIPLIGMYLASACYIFGALAWKSQTSLIRALVVAVGTALTLYVVFEHTFQISLPRGMLGDALGF